jgi:hypothetical protein
MFEGVYQITRLILAVAIRTSKAENLYSFHFAKKQVLLDLQKSERIIGIARNL